MSYGSTIFTKTPHDAVKMLENEVKEDYQSKTDSDNYYRYDVTKTFNLNFTVQPKEEFKTENMPLAKASQYKYYFIEEDTTKLNYKGECVIDNMVGTYGPLIKNFEEKFHEYCDEIELNGKEKTSLQI